MPSPCARPLYASYAWMEIRASSTKRTWDSSKPCLCCNVVEIQWLCKTKRADERNILAHPQAVRIPADGRYRADPVL